MKTTSEGPHTSADSTPAKPSCEPANKALVAALKSSLAIHGSGLRRVSVVPFDDASDLSLPGFRSGVSAVAGQFTGPGTNGAIGMWAVSSDMVRTGGGFAIGADRVTRKLSELGSFAAADSPAGADAAEVANSEAGRAARRCAEGR